MFAIAALSTSIQSADLSEFDPRTLTDVPAQVELVDEFFPYWDQTTTTNDDYRHNEYEDVAPLTNTEDVDSSTSPLVHAETTALDDALAQLRAFKAWGHNWDGENAPQPDTAMIDRAISLLSLMAPTRLTFGVGLDSESRPMFSVQDGVFDGHILVETRDAISFYFKNGGEVLDDYELPFDGRSLPGDLEQALRRI